MNLTIKRGQVSALWYYFLQVLYLIPIVIAIHYFRDQYNNQQNFRYNSQTHLDFATPAETQCKQLRYEMTYLRKEIILLRKEIEGLHSRTNEFEKKFDSKLTVALDNFYSDQIGLFDYASGYAGGSILATPDTIPYPSQYGLRIFGAFDWTYNSEPNVILEYTTFPGKCYAFYGNKGRIQIKLGHPVIVSHVSLEHLRLGEGLTSTPREFQVWGFGDNLEEKENLGKFYYDLEDSVIQTFRVTPKNKTFRAIELRILSNYGNEELTCVYRFRVHSLNLNLK